MFEGLRQDIGYLAGEARRGMSDLMGRVRAAAPSVDVHIADGHPLGVDISVGTHRWNFDASSAARYVRDQARETFTRITRQPVVQRAIATARRVEERIERAVREVVAQLTPESTPQTTTPSQQAQQAQRELRVCLERHPTQTAQAIGSQRQALQAQPTSPSNTARVARFDAAVVATCRQIVVSTPSPAARSLVVHVASLLPEPLRLQVVSCLRDIHQPTLSTSSSVADRTPSVPETAYTAVVTRPEGQCSGVWRVVYPDRRDENYYPASLNPRPVFDGFTPSIDAVAERIIPNTLGELPIYFTPTVRRPLGDHEPVVVVGMNGNVTLSTPVPTTPAPTTMTAFSNNPIPPDSLGTNTVTFMPAVHPSSAGAVTFVSVHANDQPTTLPTIPTSHVASVAANISPSRPRRSDPAALIGSFADATPANDPSTPVFVPPAYAGVEVPVSRVVTNGAPLPTSSGSNPRVARLDESHEGSGNGGRNSNGRDGNGEGEGQQGQRDRRRPEEQSEAQEAAA